MTDLYDQRHPHEPPIPPALDHEGRCLVCGLVVRAETAEKRIEQLEAEKREREQWVVDANAFAYEKATLADELATALKKAVQRCYCGSTGPTTCFPCHQANSLLVHHREATP